MSLKFGTSGIRGLAVDFTTDEIDRYVYAFVEHLRETRRDCDRVLVAGDLRESTPRIKACVESALRAEGVLPVDCGVVPTPVLAYACVDQKRPGIMITGSHIPADRNGMKFYFKDREILKQDEQAIVSAAARYSPPETMKVKKASSNFEAFGATFDAQEKFLERCKGVFEGISRPLAGKRVLFYAHSTVARELFPQLLKQLGADVESFDASETFIPVDTESTQSLKWLGEKTVRSKADVLISCDGDADRPLMIDEKGEIIPGDLICTIAARSLEATDIVYPVSCNTSIEKGGFFQNCVKTKIGSPFVVEAMLELMKQPGKRVVGFEANGGFLLGSRIHDLDPLLTRDSFLPVLLVLKESIRKNIPISELVKQVRISFTESRLIKDFPQERTRKIYQQLDEDERSAFKSFESFFGALAAKDSTDGYRFLFKSGEVVHFRPSGNAPEFRIYIEHPDPAQAKSLAERATQWIIDRS